MSKYTKYYNSQALISPEEAYQLMYLDSADYQIIDTRTSEEFSQEHAPGSISLPSNLIEQKKGNIRGDKLNPLDFQQLLSKIGVKNNTHILIMDQGNMVYAARLWWTLLIYGHQHISIIDGGWMNWKQHQLPIESGEYIAIPSNYQVNNKEQDKYLAYLFEVLSIEDNTLLLDVRNEEEFSGEACYEGAAYGGSIPNAVFLPFKEFIDTETMTIHPLEKLQEIIKKYNLQSTMPIIVYCHAGTRAALVLFILQELLGFTQIKNYNGSWIEYSHATKNTIR